MTPSVSQVPAIAARPDNRPVVDRLVARARDYASAAVPPNTQRAYASDWRSFLAFCLTHGAPALPAAPQTVALYVTSLGETCKVATVRRHLCSIAAKHRENGLESPVGHDVVRRIVRGMARTKGTAPTRKDAVTLEHLRALLLAVRGDEVKAKRDRAILLLGFACALRRSEIAALNVDDLRFTPAGLVVTVRSSKTDQEGAGVELAVPLVKIASLCAATAAREWIDAAGLRVGALFRSLDLSSSLTDHRIGGQDVALLIKSLARRAGVAGDFSGHSLRAGFVTTAAQKHVSIDRIAEVTRHRSTAVLLGYIRRSNRFDDPVLADIVSGANF